MDGAGGSNKKTNTGRRDSVPAVDIVIAGFSCKSVSTENHERQEHGECIVRGTGQTGETFRGVRNYVKRFKPSLVICENVEGLIRHNKGSPPQIIDVMKELKQAGYSATWEVLDTRNFLLPQRRRRCWMWGFRGLHHDEGVGAMRETIKTLSSEKALSIDKVTGSTILGARRKRMLRQRKITARQKRVVSAALAGNRGSDVIADINKGEARGSHGVNVAPTIVANPPACGNPRHRACATAR